MLEVRTEGFWYTGLLNTGGQHFPGLPGRVDYGAGPPAGCRSVHQESLEQEMILLIHSSETSSFDPRMDVRTQTKAVQTGGGS